MATISTPKLPEGVRLRFDKVRDRHVLLYPEGAIALNPTAVSVLELCDGVRTIDEIAAELSAKYNGADVRSDVENLVDAIAARGLIVDADS
ncbi:MAG TPA: pyrroloquinoline quinone biosynthesis peptide chaperone PqqD [Gaiellaceae bacterium]|nr:pyrroloquinoline quinone biosynthesis peptide chaperone PqqD [Gaiellaceae bacterium]